MKNMILRMSAAILLIMLGTVAFAQVKASKTAPNGITNPPQFIIVGSDDNTNAQAINWMADVLSNSSNAEGYKGYGSFYINTQGWNQARQDAVKRAYGMDHSIGNHTASHIRCVGGTNWNDPITGNHPDNLSIRKSEQEIYNEILAAQNAMIGIGILKEHQYGFRTPFLTYSDSTYSAMYKIGFLYDCSINAALPVANANFPYTLDIMPGQPASTVRPVGNVPPDNQSSWWGTGYDGQYRPGNPIREHKGLWVIPASLIEIDPADRADVLAQGAASYIPGSGWTVAGLDYNLWNEAKANEQQSVRAYMNTVKKTLAGNRAPLHFGFHSQYYFVRGDPWDGAMYDLPIDARQRIFEEFVRQASELPDVFFVTGDMVIAWMQNPCSAADFKPEDYLRKAAIPTSVVTTESTPGVSFAGIQNGQITLQLVNAGNYTVELYNSTGRLVQKVDMKDAVSGINATGIKINGLSNGVFILNVKQNGVSVLNQKISI